MGQAAGGDAASLEAEWLRRKDKNEASEVRALARQAKRLVAEEDLERVVEERGIGVLTFDPKCRGIVVCVSRGTDHDHAAIAALETALKAAHGPLVEVAHNVDEEPEDDFPFMEVWLEGYRYMVLHARNWRNDGDLTAEKIAEIVQVVGSEISDDARDILGTLEFNPEE